MKNNVICFLTFAIKKYLGISQQRNRLRVASSFVFIKLFYSGYQSRRQTENSGGVQGWNENFLRRRGTLLILLNISFNSSFVQLFFSHHVHLSRANLGFLLCLCTYVALFSLSISSSELINLLFFFKTGFFHGVNENERNSRGFLGKKRNRCGCYGSRILQWLATPSDKRCR